MFTYILCLKESLRIAGVCLFKIASLDAHNVLSVLRHDPRVTGSNSLSLIFVFWEGEGGGFTPLVNSRTIFWARSVRCEGSEARVWRTVARLTCPRSAPGAC